MSGRPGRYEVTIAYEVQHQSQTVASALELRIKGRRIGDCLLMGDIRGWQMMVRKM